MTGYKFPWWSWCDKCEFFLVRIIIFYINFLYLSINLDYFFLTISEYTLTFLYI
jgi:hypothetical protein